MTVRSELLQATDAAIEDAVRFADPMVLRGLLHQLTGDPALATMRVISLSKGNDDFEVLADKTDVATVRAAAADFLKRYRDAGARDSAGR